MVGVRVDDEVDELTSHEDCVASVLVLVLLAVLDVEEVCTI